MNAGNQSNIDELRAALSEVARGVAELREALRLTNDPALIDHFTTLVQLAELVVRIHVTSPSDAVADDLASLYSAIARRNIRRPDLGAGEGAGQGVVRGAQGNLLVDISSALRVAEEMGFVPSRTHDILPPTLEVDRALFAPALADLDRRLDAVVQLLQRELEPHGRPQLGSSRLQVGLINFYVDSMKVEVAIAKFEAAVAEIIDLVTLARAVELMGRLTGSFVSTVKTVVGKFTAAVRSAAESLAGVVAKVISGFRSLVRQLTRSRESSPENADFETFVMTLQNTDVGYGQTTAGTSKRSPEIFIPLRARDERPQFWGWPGDFVEDQWWRGPVDSDGRPKMDRTNVPFQINGKPELVTMWYNPQKRDLRLRNSALRDAGDLGDVLRIRKPTSPLSVAYLADVVKPSAPDYADVLAKCTTALGGNSQKRYGYY